MLFASRAGTSENEVLRNINSNAHDAEPDYSKELDLHRAILGSTLMGKKVVRQADHKIMTRISLYWAENDSESPT